jgi:hypothetical protein
MKILYLEESDVAESLRQSLAEAARGEFIAMDEALSEIQRGS